MAGELEHDLIEISEVSNGDIKSVLFVSDGQECML